MNYKKILNICVLFFNLILIFTHVEGMHEEYYCMEYIGTPYGGNHLYNIRLSNSEDIVEVADDKLAEYNPALISDLQSRLVGGIEKKLFDCTIYLNLKKLSIISNVSELALPASLEELRLDSSYVGMELLDLSTCKNLKALCVERGITRLVLPPSITYLKLGYTSGHKSNVEGIENCNLLRELYIDWVSWPIDIPRIIKFLGISGYGEFDLLDLSQCSNLIELSVKCKKLKRVVLPRNRPNEYSYSIYNEKWVCSCEEIENNPGEIEPTLGKDIVISKGNL